MPLLAPPCYQATVKVGPLVVLLSHWLAPQWALPPSKWMSMGDSYLAHSTKGWWSGVHEVESEVTGRAWPSPRGTPAHPAYGQLVSWEQGRGWWCPGIRLGTVSCRALEPSSRPPTNLGPGLEVVVNLSPILVSVTRTIWVA